MTDGKTVKEIKPGQTVRVHYKIREGAKTRVQPYEGMVIAVKGAQESRTFTVRRQGIDNIGIERIFPLHSPKIEKLEIISQARVRRAKLYFVRDLSRKSTRKLVKR